MSSFKVDLDGLSSNTQELLKIFREYDEEQRSFYKMLGTVDNAWNDSNTDAFLEILEADRKNNEELNNVVLNSCKIIIDFRNDVSSLLSRNGLSNPKRVSYDQYSLLQSVKSLDNIDTNLSTYIRSIQEHLVTCNAKLDIQNVVKSLNKIKKTLGDISDDLSTISKGLENSVVSVKKRLNGFTQVKIKDNRLKYNWDTVSLVNSAGTYSTTHGSTFDIKMNSLDNSNMANVTGGRDSTYSKQEGSLNESAMAAVAAPTVNVVNSNLNAIDDTSYDGVRAGTVNVSGMQRDIDVDTSTVYNAEQVAESSGYNNSLEAGDNSNFVSSNGNVSASSAMQNEMQSNLMGNVQGNNIENGEVLESFVLEPSNNMGEQSGRENATVQAGMLGAMGAVGITSTSMNDDSLETNKSFTINSSMDYSKSQNNNEKADARHLTNNQGYDGVQISQEKVEARGTSMNTQSGLQDVAIVQNSEYNSSTRGMDLQSGMDSVSISGHEDYSNLGQTFKASKLNADINTESYKADFDGINQSNFNE